MCSQDINIENIDLQENHYFSDLTMYLTKDELIVWEDFDKKIKEELANLEKLNNLQV